MSSETPEKCPYCGGIMEKGFLVGARSIFWWPDKPIPYGWIGLKPSEGKRIARSASAWQWRAPSLRAYRCTDCKVILIHAPEMEI